MSDAPEAPTATNDEIYRLVRELKIQASAVARKASACAAGKPSGQPSPWEDRSLLDEISPGADNWAIHEDLRKVSELLKMAEDELTEAEREPGLWNGAILPPEVR